jgi:hypothetical protein
MTDHRFGQAIVACPAAHAKVQKVFGSFFQKRTIFFLKFWLGSRSAAQLDERSRNCEHPVTSNCSKLPAYVWSLDHSR